jgi:membrane protease YdiL (CAAX protease family)
MAELLWRDVQGQLLWALVALAGAALLPGRGLAERLGLRRGRLGPLRFGAGLLGFLLLSNGLHRLIVGMALLEGSTLGEIDAVVREASGSAPLLVLLAIGLAPALGEELLFRGFLQRWLSLRLSGPVAVLGAAALFGLAHLDAVQGPAAFLLGAYLGTLTWLGRSLLPAILCHASNNTVAVLGVQGVIPELGAPGDPLLAAAALAAAALLLTLALRGLQPASPSADSLGGSHAEHPAHPDRR